MKDIKTSDYVSEYEFRRFSGPKYQTSSLRPVSRERRDQDAENYGEMRDGRTGRKTGQRSSLKSSDDRSADSQRGETPPRGGKTSRVNGKSEERVSNKENHEKKKPENLRRGTRTRWKKKGKTDGKRKEKKSEKKAAKKAVGSLKSVLNEMQQNANAAWDTDQRWNTDSAWEFAQNSSSTGKGFMKGIEEVVKVIVKVIKAVATTTLLPLLLILAGSLFVIITVLSAASDVSGTGGGRGDKIANPTSEKQIIYNGLLESFEGNETATIGVMCALMAESGCSPTATEAAGKWGINVSEYTAQINDGSVTKEEFVNSTYKGVQGNRGYGIAQWSTVERKKQLYEYAEKWSSEQGREFDIGNIDMQVAHLQETINTSYSSLKQALIKETDIEEACYLWISTYERPSGKYSTWREKAERDVKNYETELREECSSQPDGEYQGFFTWPCPSSHKITSYFGNRTPPKQGASSDHKGIDIGASMGSQVIASASGKVTTVSYNSARGYFIVIDHGNGYVTLYQHLSRQDVSVGDVVVQGNQIGGVGDTGISTAPHLHFEIHVNGTPVDPTLYVE